MEDFDSSEQWETAILGYRDGSVTDKGESCHGKSQTQLEKILRHSLRILHQDVNSIEKGVELCTRIMNWLEGTEDSLIDELSGSTKGNPYLSWKPEKPFDCWNCSVLPYRSPNNVHTTHLFHNKKGLMLFVDQLDIGTI